MIDDFVRSISSIGEYRTTLYVWNTLDGWYCQAGDRFSKEEEFPAVVKEEYGDDTHFKRAVNFLKGI